MLRNLGAFVRALSVMSQQAEPMKEERIPTGYSLQKQIGGTQGNLAGAFMMFKGARLIPQQIDEWEQGVYNSESKIFQVNLPPFTSYSHSITYALDMAIEEPKPATVPTLFILTCHNYMGFNGFNMGNQAYSAYPNEQEAVFNEGTYVHVLDVEKDVPLHNFSILLDQEDGGGEKITLIHLFHSM